MAISGLISFVSNDADALPVSTTKTGIEMDSDVYDHALTHCSEGIKLFTTFTNRWKGRVKETTRYFEKAKLLDVNELKLAESKRGRSAGSARANIFRPALPMPKVTKTQSRISYIRPISDIETVSRYLFNEDRRAGDVGEECFDRTLLQAKASAT